MDNIKKSRKSLRKQRKRQKLEELDNFLKNSYLKKIYSKMEFLGEYYKNIRTDIGKKEEERGKTYRRLSTFFFNNGLDFQYYGIKKIIDSISEIIGNNKTKQNNLISLDIEKMKNDPVYKNNIEESIFSLEKKIQEFGRILKKDKNFYKIENIFINQNNIDYFNKKINTIVNSINDFKNYINEISQNYIPSKNEEYKKFTEEKADKIKKQFDKLVKNFKIEVHHLVGDRSLNSPEFTITFTDNIHDKLHDRATFFMQDLDKFDNKTNLKKIKNDAKLINKSIEDLKNENIKKIEKLKYKKEILEEIKMKNSNNKLEILNSNIETSENELKILNNDINLLNKKITDLENELNKIDKDIENLYSEIIEINKQIEKNKDENKINELENKKKEKYEEIDNLYNIGNKYFSKKNIISKEKSEKDEKKNKINNEIEENKKIRDEIEEEKSKLSEKSYYDFNKKVDEKIDKLEKENENLENIKIENLNGDKESLKYNAIGKLKNIKRNFKSDQKLKNKYEKYIEFIRKTSNFNENYFIKSFGDFKNKINKLIKIEERMITEIENNQIKVLEGINSLEDNELLLEKTMESIYNFKGKFGKNFKDTLKEKENKYNILNFQQADQVNNVEFGNRDLQSLYEKIRRYNLLEKEEKENEYIVNANDSDELKKRMSHLKKFIYIAKILEERDRALKTNVANFIRSENQKIIDGNNKYIAEARERINSLKDISKCIDNIEQIKSNRQRS